MSIFDQKIICEIQILILFIKHHLTYTLDKSRVYVKYTITNLDYEFLIQV